MTRAPDLGDLIVCRLSFSLFPSQPSITGKELDKLKVILLGHCDVNKDGKIQKNELSLCLGVRPRP